MKRADDIYNAEQRLYTALTRVQYMTLEQALKTNFCNYVSVKAIHGLIKEGRAFFSSDKKYLLARPGIKPFKSRIMAYDLVLQYATNIDYYNIFTAPNENNNHVVLGFAKKKKAYEIYDVYTKDELRTVIAEIEVKWSEIKENIDEDLDDNIRFVIMLQQDELIMYAQEKINAPIVFALRNTEEEMMSTGCNLFSFVSPGDVFSELA